MNVHFLVEHEELAFLLVLIFSVSLQVVLSPAPSPSLSTTSAVSPGTPVILTCKKFLFDKCKRVLQ